MNLEEVEVPDSPEAYLAFSAGPRQLGDGLPVIPPTAERIARTLVHWAGDPDEFLGMMPPRQGTVTARAVASCAVAAGCLPEYFPVVMAIVRAMLDPRVNIAGVQPTTHPAAPLAVVSGPRSRAIGMNAGTDAFSSGNRANATIGRAVRLALRSIGGAFSGDGDMATAGSPAKYGYVVAENVAESPWESLAASRGVRGDVDAVTVFAGLAPLNIHENQTTTGSGVLHTLAGSIRIAGLNNYHYDSDVMLLLCPEHAGMLAKDGYSREDVQRVLFQTARTPLDFFSEAYVHNRLHLKFPKLYAEHDGATAALLVQDARNILVGVVGGPGKHSNFIASFGGTRAVTTAF